ncbi:hypothetical protein [Rhizomonospora bruguierae]|uniref:hypothetical protein n=1 Tax=Rhizomonospora bruguierae TaxID=1581705 RepID=UPI001BCAC629|nr:hypothetical protein [Micromonospora sp. NBRC 107566]
MRTDGRLWVNELLLDRQIFDVDGEPVGKVDDLEFTVPDDGGPPVLTAFISDTAALGPRIGGRLGAWWLAIGRRFQARADRDPYRVPTALVEDVDRTEVRLTVPRYRLSRWR